jgi:hypothetical protein
LVKKRDMTRFQLWKRRKRQILKHFQDGQSIFRILFTIWSIFILLDLDDLILVCKWCIFQNGRRFYWTTALRSPKHTVTFKNATNFHQTRTFKHPIKTNMTNHDNCTRVKAIEVHMHACKYQINTYVYLMIKFLKFHLP